MFDSSTETEYLQRAEMHEKLADTTADIPARQMHRAMAAEYRRKAAEASPIEAPSYKPIAEMGQLA